MNVLVAVADAVAQDADQFLIPVCAVRLWCLANRVLIILWRSGRARAPARSSNTAPRRPLPGTGVSGRITSAPAARAAEACRCARNRTRVVNAHSVTISRRAAGLQAKPAHFGDHLGLVLAACSTVRVPGDVGLMRPPTSAARDKRAYASHFPGSPAAPGARGRRLGMTTSRGEPLPPD